MLVSYLFQVLQQPLPDPTPVVTAVAAAVASSGSGGGSSTITVPGDLAGWIIGITGGGVIVATFWKSLVNIVTSIGVTVPRLLETITHRKEIETSALSDMQKILEDARGLLKTAEEKLTASDEKNVLITKRYRKLRSALRAQNIRHTEQMSALDAKFTSIQSLYEEQGKTLQTSQEANVVLLEQNKQLTLALEVERELRTAADERTAAALQRAEAAEAAATLLLKRAEAAESAAEADKLAASAAEEKYLRYKQLYEVADENYQTLIAAAHPGSTSAEPAPANLPAAIPVVLNPSEGESHET